MGSVGLLYVGAVLFLNGLMLIGVVPERAAAAMNLFVGGMQVVFPTIIIAQSGGDPATVLGASGLYLFGFTYLYVAWNILTGAPGEGLGWFSLFVAACAVVYGILQFTHADDPVFGMIWFAWAVLWFLFFLVLGLGREELGRTTGWFTLLLGIFTGAVPALLLLSGGYVTGPGAAAAAAVLFAVLLGAAWMLGRGRRPAPAAPAGPLADRAEPAPRGSRRNATPQDSPSARAPSPGAPPPGAPPHS